MARGENEATRLPSRHLKARILHDSGYYRAAVLQFGWLREHARLNPEERVLLARCAYEVGRRDFGLAELERLFGLDDVPLEAIIEFSRREGLHKERGERARELLEDSLVGRPGHGTILTELTRLDVEQGRAQDALKRLGVK